MGGGPRWSMDTNTAYRGKKGFDNMSFKETQEKVFSKKLSSQMNPYGVRFREARDSAEHPESVPIMIWLDVTGSMGTIPTHFIHDPECMPTIMHSIMKSGIQNPQLFFGAIGDAPKHDRAPLQIGQFESSAELINKWLEETWLEGGGGGGGYESYQLAWLFAGKHTQLDSFEKRGKKGYLFTIGDERFYENTSVKELQTVLGPGEYPAEGYSAEELLSSALELYHVFHIHVNEGSYRNNSVIMDPWRKLLGPNFYVAEDYREIPKMIGDIVYRAETGDFQNSQKHSDSPVSGDSGVPTPNKPLL